eukprot:3202476-Amphidinium_carterae.1
METKESRDTASNEHGVAELGALPACMRQWCYIADMSKTFGLHVMERDMYVQAPQSVWTCK